MGRCAHYRGECIVVTNVLVVDDDDRSRSDLVAALADAHMVRGASSAAQAMNVLDGGRVDVVILATTLGDGAWMAVLMRTFAVFPPPRVIVVSDAAAPSRAARAIKLGADDYLVRPCSAGVLQEAVERSATVGIQAEEYMGALT